MSQIDVNIIEPIPYIQIMQGVGPKGEKGDKGDPGEVTQEVFDELDTREQTHYDGLTNQIEALRTSMVDPDAFASLKNRTDAMIESSFGIRSFEISTDGNNYSDKILVQNGYSLGVVYTKGEFTLAPALFSDGVPGDVKLTYGTTTVTTPLTAPLRTPTFRQRYVAPNVIRSSVKAVLSSYNFVFEDEEDTTMEAYIKFVDIVHYGVASAGSLTDSFLLNGLSGHVLSETKETKFSVNVGAGNYIWFALPVSYGTPKFTVGGFEGGFSSQGTFNHTNNLGYRTSYEVWRSVNRGLGDVTVTIT